MRPLLLLVALSTALSAVDYEVALDRAGALLAAMPAPPVTVPVPAQPLSGDTPMIDGVLITPGERVVLEGLSLFDQGPIDGLEVLCCLKGGKNHESFARLLTGNDQLVKAAFIAALSIEESGKPGMEMSAVPARGVPLMVEAHWQSDPLLKPDAWVRAPASTLVRHRGTDRPYPALPWVFTGSRFQTFDQPIPGTKETKTVERFMLGVTMSVVVNFDEPDALLASPFPVAAQDDLFEVNSAIAPPVNSAVKFVFSRIDMPLVLTLDGAGALQAADGTVLDDAALKQALLTTFGPDATPICRALQVVAPLTVDDDTVVACRERVMRLAGLAGVWAIPVFSL
ncbi:MAG: hypothetical protein PF961_00905 [Planctomycetota bacterium]|jgi:hypothetical protein|nr:hypothetical protein [Planctomycetota bacterium]